MPDYAAQGYPRDAPGGCCWVARGGVGAASQRVPAAAGRRAPAGTCVLIPRGRRPAAAGMPCGVDARANAMLPPAVRSNRASSLFHFVKARAGLAADLPAVLPAGPPSRNPAASLHTLALRTPRRDLLPPLLPDRRARAPAPRRFRCSVPRAAAPTSPPSTSRPRWVRGGAPGGTQAGARVRGRPAGGMPACRTLSARAMLRLGACPPLCTRQRRRSYNLGTGDLIVQPLATLESMRYGAHGERRLPACPPKAGRRVDGSRCAHAALSAPASAGRAAGAAALHPPTPRCPPTRP